MARVTRRLDRDVSKLVESVTQFKSGCENFSICKEFALSNVLHHRFLSVTPSDVKRKLQRFEDRFIVNSLWSSARQFQHLKKSFLAHVTTDCPETEKLYAVLYILLKLAGQPNHKNNSPEVQNHKNECSRVGFLEDLHTSLNKICLNQRYIYEEDELSTEDELEENSCSNMEGNKSPVSPENPDSGIDVNPRVPPIGKVERKGNSDEATGNGWLKEKIVNPYWKEHHRSRQNHVLRRFLISKCNSGTVITERQLIFEFLWMVQGAEDLVAFKWDGSKYTSHRGVHLSHVSEDALSCLLRPVCHYGTIVKQLKDYITQTVHQISVQTHQAYAGTLNILINHMLKCISKLEKQLIKQDGTLSMHAVLDEMETVLKDLDVLDAVHTQSVRNVPDNGTPWEKVLCLTSCLYKQLVELDAHAFSSKTTMLLILFVNTLRPFLDFVERLITRAQILDPAQEFVIVRKEDVLKDKHFWEDALLIQKIPSSFFLHRILPDLVLAGKSMEIVSSLGLLEKKNGKTGCLFSQFKDNLWEKLLPDGALLEEGLFDILPDLESGLKKFKKTLPEPNRLLRENFTYLLFAACENNNSNSKEELELLERRLTSIHPLHLQIERSLFPLLHELCQEANKKLLSALKCCGLSDHMEVFRKYFLMEAGEVMLYFNSHLFEQLIDGEDVEDSSYLYNLMQEAISEYSSSEDNSFSRLSMSIQNLELTQQQSFKLLKKLTAITFHYEVPWPANIVLNASCLEIHQSIFTFLLQIKCAKYALDELRLKDLGRKDVVIEAKRIPSIVINEPRDETKMNVLFLLRMKLLHFINSVHTHFMINILHSTSVELQKKLQCATNFQEILQIYGKYMKYLREQCLLEDSQRSLLESVVKILDICLDFACCWRNGLQSTTASQIYIIDASFNKYHKFLSVVIGILRKRSSFCLDTLSVALLYNDETLAVVPESWNQ